MLVTFMRLVAAAPLVRAFSTRLSAGARAVQWARSSTPSATGDSELGRKHFIRNIVEEDLASGKHRRIVTRFPPEPNGV